MKKLIFILVCLCAATMQQLSAQELTLEVKGIKKTVGHLYGAIYNTEDSFMKKPLATFSMPVDSNTLTIPCNGLPAGTYAITLFQDENDNGKLDTAAVGQPLEKIGFSNNAKAVMGPPSFNKCKFDLEKDKVMVINLY